MKTENEIMQRLHILQDVQTGSKLSSVMSLEQKARVNAGIKTLLWVLYGNETDNFMPSAKNESIAKIILNPNTFFCAKCRTELKNEFSECGNKCYQNRQTGGNEPNEERLYNAIAESNKPELRLRRD